MCQIEINKLSKAGMLVMDENILIIPTFLGSLMARYSLALETMKLFTQVNQQRIYNGLHIECFHQKVSGKENLQQILNLISHCQEFSDVRLRNDDKRTLNLLNNCKNKSCIRFTMNGKIKTLDMKINW